MKDQPQQDAEHLRLLSIFHYVVAGMMALWGSFPIIHLFVGIFLLFGNVDQSKPDPIPAELAGLMFILVACSFIAVGWTMAVSTIVAGRSLRRRRHYMYCLVVAGTMSAVCVPFGTLLGVCTIIVLLRPSVKEAFGVPSSAERPLDKPTSMT